MDDIRIRVNCPECGKSYADHHGLKRHLIGIHHMCFLFRTDSTRLLTSVELEVALEWLRRQQRSKKRASSRPWQWATCFYHSSRASTTRWSVTYHPRRAKRTTSTDTCRFHVLSCGLGFHRHSLTITVESHPYAWTSGELLSAAMGTARWQFEHILIWSRPIRFRPWPIQSGFGIRLRHLAPISVHPGMRYRGKWSSPVIGERHLSVYCHCHHCSSRP